MASIAFFGIPLNDIDLLADVLCRFGRLPRQLLDFIGHDGEPLTRFARPGGFDGGVECQQVRLFGDLRDHFHHLADLHTALIPAY